MDTWRKTIIITSLGLISAGAIWFTVKQFKKQKKKRRQSKTRQFPRADDIEKERSKHFRKLQVDMNKVHLVCNEEDWDEIFPHLSNDIAVFKALGFDCEWSNVQEQISRPVSLLQLATPSGRCVLVRLNMMDKVPQTLRSLLSDKGILKVGVACYDDAQKLHADHGLCVRGCVDLRYIAVRSKSFNVGVTGLKGMAEKVLNVTLNKSYHLRCSDWEAEELSEAQIKYAAGDALVGIEIFNKLLQSKASGDCETLSDVEIWRKALTACQGIVDVNFSSKGMNKNSEKEKSISCTSGASLSSSSSSSSKKSEKQLTKGYNARKKPLYHNCKLIAPDDQLLSTCDVKKALWYVDKGLGVKVSENPLTVKLKFEPAGRPVSESNYYLQEKENICVVCGKEDSFIRKNIVPREYRKFFPSVMKDHKSHDVVLLCTACHQQCSVQDDAVKQQLAAKCNAPFSSGSSAKYTEDKTMAKVRSAAKALITSGDKLPQERKDELEQTVRDFYGVEDLDDELLEETAEMDTKVANNGFIPHGKKVVLYIMKHEGLIAFEKMWRQHFLDNMEPKFLPDMWSVDHSHDRLEMMENNLKRATKIITREKRFFVDNDESGKENSAQPLASASASASSSLLSSSSS